METNTKINTVECGNSVVSSKTAKNATAGRFRIVKLEERIAPSSVTVMSLRDVCTGTNGIICR